MNSALIAIGIRNEDLERKAIEIARNWKSTRRSRSNVMQNTRRRVVYKKARERAAKRKVK